jgi:hypothetical protein
MLFGKLPISTISYTILTPKRRKAWEAFQSMLEKRADPFLLLVVLS